jgi:internalin A
MTEMTELSLSMNRIEDISPLSSLVNLKELSIKHNSINSLSGFETMVNLTHLDVAENQITDISPLVNLGNLTWIDLSSNEISDLEVWSYYVPAEGRSLSIIIRDNPLSDLSLSTYIPRMQENGLKVIWQAIGDLLK